ncbi:hypothetical protein N5J77_18005 [Sphingobium yanoikuyae]|uniref:Uncharacterized protein n=1 Tax=Sphingobium yanoikuyae TaxID=13690 RepID=A0AA42WWG9_SPHYA|nr:hypothetical protein [Sphingobium yanoikuyae]MDH2133028.1 hypothetical protein [Sphingobium yanoikuyae]MDH2153149.1 hypothetical protein [Sphingobium yanoikuyae]MDH2170345.1 hypothetical protein [Sphingobium yanoikuyae]
MIDESEAFTLFLGNSDVDGVKSKLRATGRTYKKKMLESGTDNWLQIIDILKDRNLTAVVVKLTTHTISHICSDDFYNLSEEIFHLVSRKPHIVLLHETVLQKGSSKEAEDEKLSIDYESMRDMDDYYSYYTDPDEYFGKINDSDRKMFIDLLEDKNISIFPYKTNAEMSVLATNFVDENERNLIFRLYVPSGRIWSNEADKLLDLFRDYLTRVSGLRVRQDQYSTGQGVAYEFYGDHALDPSTLPVEFDAFSRFLDACAVNPDDASKMLLDKHLSDRAVQDIVTRYTKEARRLQVDIKQERERRVLSIRHRMASELIEIDGIESVGQINSIIDAAVPQVVGFSSTLHGGIHLPDKTANNITLNINPKIISSVNGIVNQEMLGAQNFGAQFEDLLSLIDKFGGINKNDLASAVYEMNDLDAKREDRLSASQKLKGFLFKLSGKISDVSFGVLQSYIESKLGL